MININECEPNPCHNHAKCLDQINGYQCICNSFFQGDISYILNSGRKGIDKRGLQRFGFHLGEHCDEPHTGIASANVLECGVGPNVAETNGTFISKGVDSNVTVGYASAFTCGLKIRVGIARKARPG